MWGSGYRLKSKCCSVVFTVCRLIKPVFKEIVCFAYTAKLHYRHTNALCSKWLLKLFLIVNFTPYHTGVATCRTCSSGPTSFSRKWNTPKCNKKWRPRGMRVSTHKYWHKSSKSFQIPSWCTIHHPCFQFLFCSSKSVQINHHNAQTL